MSRVTKKNPGRILFVGSGPGDPALLTVRAREVLGWATLEFTDPDVDKGVLALIGIAVEESPDGTRPVDVRPALGGAAEVAKTLIAEARGGSDVVRLVSRELMTADKIGWRRRCRRSLSCCRGSRRRTPRRRTPTPPRTPR